jgi:transaldolase
MRTLADLRISIFADGADRQRMLSLRENPLIQGFTTNPTLMRKAGITDYESFAKEVLAAIPDRPISFEVFSDEVSEMQRQARTLASWGTNVYVKIPVTNTRGESTASLVRSLAADGVKLNVTALLTVDQVSVVSSALEGGPSSYISVFAGRIADTGRDPIPMMKQALDIMRSRPEQQLIWASPRELLNIFQADWIGCHVITVTSDLLAKLAMAGKDLGLLSLETVQMFHTDAQAAGFTL